MSLRVSEVFGKKEKRDEKDTPGEDSIELEEIFRETDT
jgi:hypothetical protein